MGIIRAQRRLLRRMRRIDGAVRAACLEGNRSGMAAPEDLVRDIFCEETALTSAHRDGHRGEWVLQIAKVDLASLRTHGDKLRITSNCFVS